MQVRKADGTVNLIKADQRVPPAKTKSVVCGVPLAASFGLDTTEVGTAVAGTRFEPVCQDIV